MTKDLAAQAPQLPEPYTREELDAPGVWNWADVGKRTITIQKADYDRLLATARLAVTGQTLPDQRASEDAARLDWLEAHTARTASSFLSYYEDDTDGPSYMMDGKVARTLRGVLDIVRRAAPSSGESTHE